MVLGVMVLVVVVQKWFLEPISCRRGVIQDCGAALNNLGGVRASPSNTNPTWRSS